MRSCRNACETCQRDGVPAAGPNDVQWMRGRCPRADRGFLLTYSKNDTPTDNVTGKPRRIVSVTVSEKWKRPPA